MKKIVVFASGGGSSVENLYLYFSKKPNVKILKLYCNNPEAGVLERNRINSLEKLLFTNNELNSDKILNDLQKLSPDLIVLAGFLKKIPEKITSFFTNKIINIHPSLLPKYGGKGMYGNNVHKAVLAAGEKKTGITIHYVNEHYDKGAIIKQFETALSTEDTLESVGLKIKELEKKYFPSTIEELTTTTQL